MKIAIVCGHYIPAFGYIEVHLANAWKKLGHEVHVITSTETPSYVKNIACQQYTAGTNENDGIAIHRLKPVFSMGQMVRCKGIPEKLNSLAPDIVVCIGVGKLFCNLAYSTSFPVITLLGNTVDNYWLVAKTAKQKLLLPAQKVKLHLSHKLFKNKAYKLAVKHSTKICSYTPEAVPIVKRYIPSNLHQRLESINQNISLGFDDNQFFYDTEERKHARERLQLKDDDILLVTATRVTRHKKLEDIIELVTDLNKKGATVKYLIVGFSDDAYGKELKEFIQQQPDPGSFFTSAFLPHDELRKMYAAADIGLWVRPTISTLEAMGCGLPIVMENRPKVSHLLTEKNGWYCQKNNMQEVLTKAINQTEKLNLQEREKARKEIVNHNEAQFSYKHIASKIIEGVFE